MKRWKTLVSGTGSLWCNLFGSCAEKAYHALLHDKTISSADPLTDIDIGVVFKDLLPIPEKRHLLYADLYHALAELFPSVPVDLVFLEENHSVFQSEVIKGHCLYAVNQILINQRLSFIKGYVGHLGGVVQHSQKGIHQE
ncbi:MAG TPA: hypothetical protein VLH40_07960 [Atribacteraceae bacterium]|nr:hypothetical protein [Atribacteraceae bacterium]